VLRRRPLQCWSVLRCYNDMRYAARNWSGVHRTDYVRLWNMRRRLLRVHDYARVCGKDVRRRYLHRIRVHVHCCQDMPEGREYGVFQRA